MKNNYFSILFAENNIFGREKNRERRRHNTHQRSVLHTKILIFMVFFFENAGKKIINSRRKRFWRPFQAAVGAEKIRLSR